VSEEETAPRFHRLLSRKAPEFGLALPEEAIRRLARHLAELSRWRGATDLVGRLSEEELAAHALESALGARLLSGAERLLDIGSGAGFPGLPLAILGFRVTLLEPRQRRAAFLRHVLRKIPGLNAEVRVARVEALSRAEFGAASARAVGDLGDLVGEGKFLEEGGKLLIWTAGNSLPARALPKEIFRPAGSLEIPGSRSRRILVFEKCSTGNTGAPVPGSP
jgi:16S rRNA (guanine527-N7)-methyltransferase